MVNCPVSVHTDSCRILYIVSPLHVTYIILWFFSVFHYHHHKSGGNNQTYLNIPQPPKETGFLLHHPPIWILTATKTSPAAFANGEVMLKYRFIWMDSLNQLSGGYFTYFSVFHIFQNSSQPVQVFFYIDIVNSVPVMRFTAIDHVFSCN